MNKNKIENKSKLKIFAKGAAMCFSIMSLASLTAIILKIGGGHLHSFQEAMLLILVSILAIMTLSLMFGCFWLFINKDKDFQNTGKIVSRVEKEASKNNPKKTLLANVVFGSVLISFLILFSFVVKNSENKQLGISEKILIGNSSAFSVFFFGLVWFLTIAVLSGRELGVMNKIEKK